MTRQLTIDRVAKTVSDHEAGMFEGDDVEQKKQRRSILIRQREWLGFVQLETLEGLTFCRVDARRSWWFNI